MKQRFQQLPNVQCPHHFTNYYVTDVQHMLLRPSHIMFDATNGDRQTGPPSMPKLQGSKIITMDLSQLALHSINTSTMKEEISNFITNG